MTDTSADVDHVSLAAVEGEPHALPFGDVEPRTVRLSLSAGERVAEHSHPGRTVVCYVVDGELDMSLDGESHRLVAGDLVRFPGECDVAPAAVEDTTALLVLAERGD